MLKPSHPLCRSLISGVALLALAASSSSALAKNNTAKLTVEPAMAKMQSFFKSGDLIPVKGSGAVIEVYGGNGNYEGIANLTGTTSQPWRVEARSWQGNTLLKSWLEINGVNKTVFENSKINVRGHEPRTVSTAHRISTLDIGVDPVKACNSELAMRAAKSGKSRVYWQQRGFVLKVEGGLKGKAKMQYLTSLGKRTMEEPASAPVYIACLPENLQGKKPQPQAKPKPRPGKLLVKMKPVVSVQGAGRPVKTDLYSKKCPVQARFQAEVLAPRSMTVRYRYIGKDWRSPVKKKQLKKGRQTLPVYVRKVGKPKAGGVKLKGGAAKPDYTGWAAVEILQTGKNIVSKKEPFRVYCREKTKPVKPGTASIVPGKLATPARSPQP